MTDTPPKRRHLRRLKQIFETSRAPVYFVTVCSFNRKKILTELVLANEIGTFFRDCERRYGWRIGRFVIMPDHVHFFCRPGQTERNLSELVRDLKKWTAHKAQKAGYEGKIWQNEFFDRLLRNHESYLKESQYMKENPVRACLVERFEAWPWQGEITPSAGMLFQQ